jgi:glycosyltransferase involved in cell wall biosynthesis
VRNEVNGLLCRVADAQSLAAAMRRMAQAGPGQRSAWGDTARRMAERDYDERIVHAAYVEAIESPAQPR